ncbi:MAG: hypothetical protein K8T20_00920, partial [Planctomycetes bacterium]|nr:hypothetical protein [Planctomycetota bacterium]
TTVQNVFTYTVMLAAENKDEKLLPGMTASVSFEVEHAKDVLKVPNAALRFLPAGEAPLADNSGGGKRGEGRGEGKPEGKPEGKTDWKRVTKGRVWISGPSGPFAVLIETGSTDGSFTVLTKGELIEGQEVITGLAADTKDSGMSNPFAPSRGPGGGGGGGGRGR